MCLNRWKETFLYKYHELGHLGTEKTTQAILESYWFPETLRKDELSR